MPLGLFYSCALSPLPWTQWLMGTPCPPSAAEEIGAGHLAQVDRKHALKRCWSSSGQDCSTPTWLHVPLPPAESPGVYSFPPSSQKTQFLSKFLAIESLTQDFLDQRKESPPSMNWPGQEWGWLWPPEHAPAELSTVLLPVAGDLCRPGTSQVSWGLTVASLTFPHPALSPQSLRTGFKSCVFGISGWFPFLWQNPGWHR